MKEEKRILKLTLIVFLSGLAACQNAPLNSNKNVNTVVSSTILPSNGNANSAANANQTKSAAHEHAAPHGGTIITFGEEFAHLELVLDAASGELTAYALYGEAEKSLPLAQTEIEIEIEKPQKFSVKLAARENALTGEKRGATSEFRGQSEQLKNLNEFDARVKSITIRGKEFKDVHFNFPKGNEANHEH
ncbi:MAG TPA: hypothetical protein VNI84_03990 [Pyrinomonadaceae bacterium]|nr:hypothetical protein [Pyrinomonadaceae bacterium]